MMEDNDKKFDSEELKLLAKRLRDEIEIKDRKFRFSKYEKCFIGQEACSWMIQKDIASDAPQAEAFGNLMIENGIFHHVLREHGFKNDFLFYRFSEDEDHGMVDKSEDGKPASWYSLVAGDLFGGKTESLIPQIPDNSEELGELEAVNTWGVTPMDKENARLLENVRPKAWKDPEPKERYDMLVIGAGSGGLVTAAGSVGVGAKVALVEEHMLGGDCLNFGCVPSKALLSAAKVAKTLREAVQFGIGVEGIPDEELAGRIQVDFPKVMERLRRLRSDISRHDAATRFADDLGIDLFLGRGVFTGPNSVEVNGKTLHFSKCCIATGGTPAIPSLPGLSKVPFYTNMNVFNLTERPSRVGVIGNGVIGIEMAQAFQRLGSQVTVFSRSDTKLLPREDPEAAAFVQKALEKDGVDFATNAKYKELRLAQTESDSQTFPPVNVLLEDGREYEFDALIIATGRKPNVQGLGLEKIGVDFDPGRGVSVNDNLRTSVSHIFAVGDVATKYQFTHTADFMARMVIRNALFFGKAKFSELIIPWCTFTDPEIAHVGLYEKDLRERDIAFQTFTRDFKDVDRCVVDQQTDGFVRVHVRKGSDQILGATIVGQHAGDMISEITLAMQSETGLSKLANVIHPYPTAAEAVRQVGDQYNKTRMTPMVRRLLRGIVSIQ